VASSWSGPAPRPGRPGTHEQYGTRGSRIAPRGRTQSDAALVMPGKAMASFAALSGSMTADIYRTRALAAVRDYCSFPPGWPWFFQAAANSGRPGRVQRPCTSPCCSAAPVYLRRILRIAYHKSQKTIISPQENRYAVLAHRNLLYVPLAPEPGHVIPGWLVIGTRQLKGRGLPDAEC
jgi:hypothetical protein